MTDGSGVILAIDTALQRAVVALGDGRGELIDGASWIAGHRHGEELLPRLKELLAANGVALKDVSAIVCGTGPGAFTGLRVGIATAKALAHGLGCPIVGVSTAEALLAASSAAGDAAAAGAGAPAGGAPAVLLPAGPSDRVLVVDGEARLLPAGTEPDDAFAAQLIAVDLPGRAPERALARGERANAGLAAALVRIGAGRLARGEADDLARLVPQYVTLPRGVATERGEVAWSHGRR